jgi:pimeloyl-ACP methyl ester carboxylesterase
MYKNLRCCLLVFFVATVGLSLAFSPQAFVGRSRSLTATTTDLTATGVTTLVQPDTSTIQERACVEAAARMQRIDVPVSKDIHPNGMVGISFVQWPSSARRNNRNSKKPAIILVHGFDSSCLEYRRLGPVLAAKSGFDVYAVDLLGWGFSQLDGVSSFSADAKVQALQSFIATVTGNNSNPFYIAGASLGGAAAIEVAASSNAACQGLVLLDAQGFVDGIGPMASLPTPLAKLGVGVLSKLEFCCENQISTVIVLQFMRLHNLSFH